MTEYLVKELNKLSHPFTSSHYTLNSCNLQELTQEDTIILGQNLVQIDPWKTLNYSAKGLSNYLFQADPLLYKFGIISCRQLVGVVCIRYPWLRGAYLELLAIYPTQQGRGIGKEVILWFESEAKQTSRNIWTLVSSFNTKARHFYNGMGFVEIGTLESFVVSGYDELLLRKVIS